MFSGLNDDAERVLAMRTALMRENAKVVGTEAFSKIQEAQIAFFDGQLAAWQGDYKAADEARAEDRGSGRGREQRAQDGAVSRAAGADRAAPEELQEGGDGIAARGPDAAAQQVSAGAGAGSDQRQGRSARSSTRKWRRTTSTPWISRCCARRHSRKWADSPLTAAGRAAAEEGSAAASSSRLRVVSLAGRVIQSAPHRFIGGAMTDTKWTLHGREFANCNCSYGCPCQFNALPTHGNCWAVVGIEIDKGHHGDGAARWAAARGHLQIPRRHSHGEWRGGAHRRQARERGAAQCAAAHHERPGHASPAPRCSRCSSRC